MRRSFSPPGSGTRIHGWGLLVSAVSLATCVAVLGGCARSTAIDNSRASSLGGDPLLQVTLPGARPGPIGVSTGAGRTPGASPSLARREWQLADPVTVAFVALLDQVPTTGWRLSTLVCGSPQE